MDENGMEWMESEMDMFVLSYGILSVKIKQNLRKNWKIWVKYDKKKSTFRAFATRAKNVSISFFMIARPQ